MYLCRKCGAEFIDPLGGRCPMCGVRVKPSWEEKQAGEASLPPGMGEVKPAPESESVTMEFSEPEPAVTITRSYRAPETEQPVDRFPDTGVYGPPKDYGGPAPSLGGSPRRGMKGVIVMAVLMMVLTSVVGVVIFLLSGECDMEEAVGGFTQGVDKAVSDLEPLWRDRSAEMREAGYEPVAGLPPDLWPVADSTLWFVGDDTLIYYEAVKDQELKELTLPGGASPIGDIHPTPDGTGIVAVLRTADGLGVYRLTTGGEAELLLDGEALFNRLMGAHSGDEGYVRDLSRARSSGELLRQPRLDEAAETLYVAAGPPGKYELWTADLGAGTVEPLETYNANTIPCLVSGGVLYYQHQAKEPGESALVYARTLATGTYEFIMTAGNAGGIISFDLGEDGTLAYLGRDYQDTPVVFYQRPGENFSENCKVPGDAPESVAVGPGGVIVAAGAYEDRDNVIFLNLDDLDGKDMPQIRYWTGISDIRSTCLGPPLTAP
ncbi:MAG: hypothetical protein NTW26_05480 [bacterium]|nr:hypothetical protein [bacterium]